MANVSFTEKDLVELHNGIGVPLSQMDEADWFLGARCIHLSGLGMETKGTLVYVHTNGRATVSRQDGLTRARSVNGAGSSVYFLIYEGEAGERELVQQNVAYLMHKCTEKEWAAFLTPPPPKRTRHKRTPAKAKADESVDDKDE